MGAGEVVKLWSPRSGPRRMRGGGECGKSRRLVEGQKARDQVVVKVEIGKEIVCLEMSKMRSQKSTSKVVID